MVYSSRENFTATMLHSNEFDAGVTSRSLTMVDETVVNDWQISQNHFSDSSSVPPPPVWGSAGPGAGSGTSKKSSASTNTVELSDEQVSTRPHNIHTDSLKSCPSNMYVHTGSNASKSRRPSLKCFL